MVNPSNNQDSSKMAGQYHSVKGSMVETAGDVTGNQSWQQSGKEEHARGESQYKTAQGQGYAEGVSDRMGGYKDSVAGAVTGDKSQQATGNARKEKGQTQQEMNRPSQVSDDM